MQLNLSSESAGTILFGSNDRYLSKIFEHILGLRYLVLVWTVFPFDTPKGRKELLSRIQSILSEKKKTRKKNYLIAFWLHN